MSRMKGQSWRLDDQEIQFGNYGKKEKWRNLNHRSLIDKDQSRNNREIAKTKQKHKRNSGPSFISVAFNTETTTNKRL